MSRCTAKTVSGNRCRLSSIPAATYCHLHKTMQDNNIQVRVFPISADVMDNMIPVPPGFVTHEILTNLFSNTVEKQIAALDALKLIRTQEQVDDILASGILPNIITYATNDEYDERVRTLACWVLTNLSSLSDESGGKAIYDTGVCEKLLDISFTHPNSELASQALWCVANVSVTNAAYSNKFISYDGIIEKLCNIMLNISSTLDKLRTATHMLGSLSDFVSHETAMYIMNEIPKFPPANITDSEVLTSIMNTIKTIYKKTRSVGPISLKFFMEIINQTIKPNTAVSIKNALYIVGDIISSNGKELIKRLIDMDVITTLWNLTKSKDCYIRNEALWTISNVVCEKEAIEIVMNMPGFLSDIVYLADKNENAIWTISNILSMCENEHAVQIVWSGAPRALVRNLSTYSDKITTVALEGLLYAFEKQPLLTYKGLHNTDFINVMESKCIPSDHGMCVHALKLQTLYYKQMSCNPE